MAQPSAQPLDQVRPDPVVDFDSPREPRLADDMFDGIQKLGVQVPPFRIHPDWTWKSHPALVLSIDELPLVWANGSAA